MTAPRRTPPPEPVPSGLQAIADVVSAVMAVAVGGSAAVVAVLGQIALAVVLALVAFGIVLRLWRRKRVRVRRPS